LGPFIYGPFGGAILAVFIPSICHTISEAREGFHHFLDSSGLEGELTDMEILAFEERFMEEMQVQPPNI
jgi:hypothetical protein